MKRLKSLSIAVVFLLFVFLCGTAFGAASLFNYPKFKALDSNGKPISGGLLYTYAPGTTTPKATYADKAKATANANPVVLDSNGEATIFLDGYYKTVLKSAAGVTQWTMDNVQGIGSSVVDFLTISDYSGDLSAALTAIGSDSKTLYIDQAVSVTANTTVPANVQIKMQKPGMFTISTAKTLTINGPFEAGLYQVFSHDNTDGVVFGPQSISHARPEWWGLSQTATDAVNSIALQSAVNCGVGIVSVPNGDYSYSTGLTFTKAIRFEGDSTLGSSATTYAERITRLEYTGTGVAMTLYGLSANGVYNIHLSNFLLIGNALATGGIKIGTSYDDPVIHSSITNVTVDLFSKSGTTDTNGGYGIKIMRMQQSHMINVYAHQNDIGWHIGYLSPETGGSTTITFINCQSKTNTHYGWYIKNLIGSAFINCLGEANGDAALWIYSSEANSLSFHQWHSESNNLTSGTASHMITGDGTVGSPIYITFYGGYFVNGVDVGTGVYRVFDVNYANIVNWINITHGSYGDGFIRVTANTLNSTFTHGERALLPTAITGNTLGGVAVNGRRIDMWEGNLDAATLGACSQNTWYAVFTPTVEGVYLIAIWVHDGDDANYVSTATVIFDGTHTLMSGDYHAGTYSAIQISGHEVQARQTAAVSATLNYSVKRL